MGARPTALVPNPAEARSDAEQALKFDDFEERVAELEEIPSFGPPRAARRSGPRAPSSSPCLRHA
jgi:hypothetical protein